MAGVVQNLIYRVSVSAIVGAIVAGGLIYLNNDRVVKSYRAEQSLQTEQQDMTNKALMEANDNLASAISVMEAEQAQQLADLGSAFSALEAKIDAIPAAETADYSEITAAIEALDADLTAKIDAIVPAVQEQN
ncbi:MAG: hypothetical protein KAS85_08180 [Rhodobacteraceae bacterium]|nr:hypothetical protein [Paracoccaceae bacterium]